MISFITSTFALMIVNFYVTFSSSHSNSHITIIQSEFCKVELCYSASKSNHSDAIVVVPAFNNSLPSLQQP